jgi:hypothetical protein
MTLLDGIPEEGDGGLEAAQHIDEDGGVQEELHEPCCPCSSANRPRRRRST